MRTKRTGKASRALGRSADDGWGFVGQRGMDDGGSTLWPPFLAKLYDMVADPATDTVISWAPAGGSFVVRDRAELYTDLLPKYLGHRSMLKFVRQLITFGFRFRKVDHGVLEFAREGFVRQKAGHPMAMAIQGRSLWSSQRRFKDLKEEMMVTTDGMSMLTEQLKELTEKIKDLKEEMMVAKDGMSMLTEELKLTIDRLREPPQAEEIDIHVSVPQTPELAVEVLRSQDGSEVYSCSSPSYEPCSDSSSS